MKAVWVLAASGCLVAACGEKAEVVPTLGAAASGPADTAARTATLNAAAGAVAPAAPAVPAAPATASAGADRLPPPAVPPVDRGGVRYSQAEDGRSLGMAQVGGVLVASDIRSEQRLWALAVYDNPINPKLEADVQWLYFKSMAFDADGRLRIVNEAGRTYFVDVNTRRVSAVR